MGNLETGFAAGVNATGRKLGFFSLPDSKTFEKEVTVAEALELSGMNFHVGKQPLYRKNADGEFVEAPKVYEHYRTDLDRHLGAIGNQNTALQNEAAFGMIDEMLGYGALIRSAGTWNGGADVFICAQLQNGIHIPQYENADLYCLFRNNHAGKGGVSMHITPVDPRCTNMFGTAVKGAVAHWSCRHTQTVSERVHEATAAMGLVDKYRTAMESTIKQLQETEMELDEFENFVKELTEYDSEKPEKGQRVRNQLIEVYNTSPNLTPGNRWGAFSAVTETLDWHPSRQSGPETRFASQVDGPISRTRQRAMNLLTR